MYKLIKLQKHACSWKKKIEKKNEKKIWKKNLKKKLKKKIYKLQNYKIIKL